MPHAVISDIHGNQEALEVVLKKIHELGINEIKCLGDVVGYGPNPNECIDLIKNASLLMLGNHDAFAAGVFPKVDFVGSSYHVVYETTKSITEENRLFLKIFKPEYREADKIYAHGNPACKSPYCLKEYLLADMQLREDARRIPGTKPVRAVLYENLLCDVFDFMLGKGINRTFVGHTHLAFAARRPKILGNFDGIEVFMARHNIGDADTSFELELDPDYQYIFNPGSVGQPRDHDKRASFMVYDENKAVWHRCEYDRDTTVKKLSKFNIYYRYRERLSLGE